MNIADQIRCSNIEVHRLEAAIYDAVHPEIFGSFEQRRIARDLDLISSVVPEQPAPHVLDLGCGTGNLTLKYLQRGYWVRAVDISPEMIGVLRAKLDPTVLHHVDLLVSGAEEVVADIHTHGTWDVISFSSVLHHLPDYRIVLKQSLQQLRPGGVLYVCHEPLQRLGAMKRVGFRLMETILDRLDSLYINMWKSRVYLTQAHRRPSRLLKRMDYGLSDYHARLGIDAEDVVRELKSAGATTLVYETYRSHYSSVLAALDARFDMSAHSHFRFIIRR
jgi:2-polyprenyl-3-methyl-5-hydroxy-6-metoxy-1,4-benzoquinol methylase